MFNSFNICLALESIKKICDSNRCIVCDKAVGQFKRYSCGHTTCDVCALMTGFCMLCLTPPEKTTSNNYLIDDISTKRVTNAFKLLNAFEKAFNVDVYKHQKMAKQLKLEKDLFPECIQAPNKYFNKRKSYSTYVKKKENQLSKLPGEAICSTETRKIEKSIYSVEQWLNKNKESNYSEKNINNKNENDESGIVIDSSFIDCSLITEDKDKQALLAVYEADQKEQMSDSLLTMESKEWQNDIEISTESPKMLQDELKVPFFKKSKLVETNAICDSDTSILNISTNMLGETKTIQVIIPSKKKYLKPKDFIKKLTSTPSIHVQTDICSISHIKENINLKGKVKMLDKNIIESTNDNELSQDIFTPEESHNNLNALSSNMEIKRPTKSITIKESDSDDGSVNEAKILEVSAQVHQFEHPVLSDITYMDSHEEPIRQQNGRRRRLTPDSSNSSEKENLNPNRRKKHKYGKKIKK